MVSLDAEKSTGIRNSFAELFQQHQKTFQETGSWFFPMRQTAEGRFLELGFPTAKNENWKYTSVQPIREGNFKLSNGASRFSLSKRDIEKECFFKKGPRLVFLGGVFSKELSSLDVFSKGIQVTSMAKALQDRHPLAEKHVARHASFYHDAFAALNTAFFQDGALIVLDDFSVSNDPIEILFISSSDETAVSFPRVLVAAGKKSKATLIEHYLSSGSNLSFTSPVTEAVLDEGSEVHYVKLTQESKNAFHVGNFHADQSVDSLFSLACIDLDGKLSRTTLKVVLRGENARCLLNGLYLTENGRHVDNTTLIEHAVPRGTSRQLYKGILEGKSTAVFNGKIFVHEGAEKTDAEQTNKNLILSDEAAANTRPQLEIFADDVKCTHGAAVGQLEEDHLFYFKSRGIGPEKARRILSYGFAREVVECIPVAEVREVLDRFLLRRLGL